LHSYYETLDFTPFDRNEGFPTDAALLKHLKRLSPGSKVLDFGCSTGRILAELGSAYERFGIEINEAAADRARGHGIAIISERDLRDGMTEKFDAIVLSDVFEHLLEPTKTLRLLTSRLATSGKLYIVTALSDTIRQRALIPEHWYFRIPGHLQMLSRDHLIWIAASLGLQMTSLDVMSHYRRDPIRFAKQRLQSLLYEKVKLAPRSVIAAVVRSTPSLNRVGKWTNLPMTDQLRDHAVAVLTNTR
jgi:SAM-dependent methyltransferase